MIGKELYHDLPKEVYDDKELLMIAVSKNGEALRYASVRLQDDEEVVMKCFETKTDKYAIRYASERIQNLPGYIPS